MPKLTPDDYRNAVRKLGLKSKLNYYNRTECMFHCPFHSDWTPSFNVNFEKGISHCFQCDRSFSIPKLVKELAVPIFVDTKKTDLSRLAGCYIKINKLEQSRATSLPEADHLIVTYGHLGAAWNGWVYPAEIAGDVTDVTGAGDTFLAALVYKYLETNHMPDAVKFAIKASAITVQHVGVYAPRLEEIG